jgi:crotonobetainyl-CoA:carnitine CoA-transferase CaiB-like acyl-CoA transferase
VVYVPDGESTQPMVATPADFGGTPCEPRSTAPALGAHTEEILDQLARRHSAD